MKVNHSGLRTWLEIDTQALKNNFFEFKKVISQETKFMAVVKSNAYGHGLIETSQYFARFGADFLGVDSIVEARTLRQNGVRIPILVLGFSLPEIIDYALKNDVSLTVSSLDFFKSLKLKKSQKKLKIHIKVETGLNRQGFNENQIDELIKIIKKNQSVELEGVYTHLANAKNPLRKSQTEMQIKIFKCIIGKFKSEDLDFISHSAASSSSLIFKKAHLDMVRVGIGLYGLWPSEETKRFFDKGIKLIPALSWKTVIGEIKTITKGEKIGYGHTFTAKKKTRIAICPVGYWHGYPRNLSNKGYFLVNGKKANVLGVISMDMIIIDVTNIKDARFNQEVTIIGREKSSEITVDELAIMTKTTNYEFITRINPLIKRFYV